MSRAIDFNTIDLTILLSDSSVQQLLDIAEKHSEWSIEHMVAAHPKNAQGEKLFSYDAARVILKRLHLLTVTQRRLHHTFTKQLEDNSSQQPITDLFPDLLFYAKHRQDYLQKKAQQEQTRQDNALLSYTPKQQTTIRHFDKFFALSKQFLFIFLASFFFFLGGSFVFDTLFQAQSVVARIGMFFAFAALACGMLFFLYSLKYYLTIAVILSFSRSEPEEKGKRSGIGGFLGSLFGVSVEIETQGGNVGQETTQKPAISLRYDLSNVQLERLPFVSIHVATYNEKRVIDRFLLAATSMEYPNYEIIVADDSTDETTQLLAQWKTHPKVKISHRTSREGYKGGALKEALNLVDPRTEFILIFDADFIPYPDAIVQFLKYFQAGIGDLQPETIRKSSIAAVQGYQWHVLNKSENWITRGVRSEYAGSYVIERSGTEVYQGLKQISGSVYMIRRDVLQQIGWGTSITEDFELTLKLYEKGYKVVYTPYIQSPAEAVSTIKRLIRQRMRWAEGHSFNVKRLFTKLLFSPRLTLSEKFEFLYLAPYYLQAFLFILGTVCWFTAEIVFQTRLPFWTETWGWSLVAFNLCALPLMNLIGLFLENSDERDYLGLLSFVLLSYIVAPFQAFAAVKGFLDKEEGPWFRTPKTGRITDSFLPTRFSRFLRNLLGKPVSSQTGSLPMPTVSPSVLEPETVPALEAMRLPQMEARQSKSLSTTLLGVLRIALLVKSPGELVYSASFLLFILGAFAFLLLSFWLPMQDILLHLLMRLGWDSFLQQTTVPYELHFISTLLTFFGFHIQTGNEYITWQKALGTHEYIFFTWNCGGWQSVLLFLVSALAGLRGKYTLFSKWETFILGIVGTYLFTMFRLTAVLIVYILVGRPLGIFFHDYLTIFLTFGYLALFWWFANRFLLREKQDVSFSHLVFGRGTVAIVVIFALLSNYLVFFTHVPVAHASSNPTIEQQINIIDHTWFGLSTGGDGIMLIDTANYTSATYYFEVVAKVTSGSGTAVLTYNAGTGTTPSGGSTVTISSINTTSYARYRSSSFSPTGAQNAYVSSKTGTGMTIRTARIIVVQSDATAIDNTVSQVEIGDFENTTSNGTTLTNPKYWTYDSSKYDGTVTVYFEATFEASNSNAAVNAYLSPSGSFCSLVTGSNVSNSAGATFERHRSGDISSHLTNGNTYMVCIGSNNVSTTMELANAHLIIQQTSTSGLTKMEIQHMSINTGVSTTSSSYTLTNYLFQYNPSDWAAGTFTYYFEANIFSNANTAFSQLYNSTDGSAISSSEVSTANGSNTLVRSGSLTMPSATKDMDTQIKNSSNGFTAKDLGSWLIIDVSSLQTPENVLPFLPLTLFIPALINYVDKRRKGKQVTTP